MKIEVNTKWLKWAPKFVARDATRGVLQYVCVDGPEGLIWATDGRVAFAHEIEKQSGRYSLDVAFCQAVGKSQSPRVGIEINDGVAKCGTTIGTATAQANLPDMRTVMVDSLSAPRIPRWCWVDQDYVAALTKAFRDVAGIKKASPCVLPGPKVRSMCAVGSLERNYGWPEGIYAGLMPLIACHDWAPAFFDRNPLNAVRSTVRDGGLTDAQKIETIDALLNGVDR